MGTDIHGYVEVRNGWIDTSEPDDDDLFLRWHPAMNLRHLYDGRSYEAFGCLFGVRGRTFEPLAAGRGFPADASRATRRAYAWEEEDSHSPTWITWAELAAVDWDERDRPLPHWPHSLTRREAVPKEEWGDLFEVMHILAHRHGSTNVRLVVWFDN
ncbi:hypothetical protein [Streptomyces sp. NPDC003635]